MEIQLRISRAQVLGHVLWSHRMLAGVRQVDVAGEMEIGHPQVSNIEAGKSQITVVQLMHFAEAVGTEAAALVAAAENAIEVVDRVQDSRAILTDNGCTKPPALARVLLTQLLASEDTE